MSRKFLVNADFAKNQILNAVIQNLSSAPGSPVEGLIYFDTTLHQFGCYQNSVWTYLSTGASNAITRAAAAAASDIMIVSAGADRTAKDYAGGAGIVKAAANGAVSPATAGTDYTTPAGVESLTNKTINASSNTITNITTAMLAAAAFSTDGTLSSNSDTIISSQKAIKTYVDGLLQGVAWKAPVRAATTANGTLATAFANGQVIDGVTLATGDRILLKDQTTGTENGIYTVNASGAPTRAVDADAGAELSNMVVDVREGTANSETAWVLTNNGTITIGSTSLVFVDFVKANVPNATTAIFGKVQLASQAEAEAKTDTAKAVVSADLLNFPIKKIFTIGDGSSTSIVVTHSLGTKDVMVQVRDASTDAIVICDIVNTNTTQTTLTFSVAPASNAYKVVIIG